MLLGTTSILTLLFAGSVQAQSLPSGGAVTSGAATISGAGSNLLITQTSPTAILSWDSFSIGAGHATHFDNGAGATLNRVTGTLPSNIDGTLSATGSLYLVNSAGVAVGSGGMVRTGGSFVASTLDAGDTDFLNGGDLVLAGSSKAGIVNEGVIASLGGDVVLTARLVENTGTILAPQGSVGLLAGYEVLLRDLATEDGKFAVRVGGADTEVRSTGSVAAVNAELRANGGNVLALAGNTEGVIKATGVYKQGGRIFLTAGAGGSVKATQRIVAKPAPQPATRSTPAGGVVRIAADKVTLGGAIDVSGDSLAGGTIIAVAREQLELTAVARLDASGSAGGLILLGGDYQGGKSAATNYWDAPIGTTAQTVVAGGATITANGATGAGGNVVVWGDAYTRFAGTIAARGLTQGGDAEVSGKAQLAYHGFADLGSANGVFGTLLLDPYNVTISTGTDTMGGGFDATGPDSVLNAGRLQLALTGANVTVSTGAGGGQAGDITVATPLSWSDTTLMLNAAHSIAINAPLTIGGTGGLALTTNVGGGTGGMLSFAGGVSYSGSGGGLNINNQAYELLYSMADLQGINTSARLSGHYALAQSLDATGVTGWVPLGTDGRDGGLANGFSGRFTGLGNTIANLDVDIGNYNYAGLFGFSSGAISDIGLLGGSVSGGSFVGGLVGYQASGEISQSYTTGAIRGIWYIGGLVGQQAGSISQSYATGVVTGDDHVGGLVGQQAGSISQSYATGVVTGDDQVGGLVGHQAGSISQSYATGVVTGDDHVGGLVGHQAGSISQSYATGVVTGDDQVGGLVGHQAGSISQSYFDSYSAGRSNGVGAHAVGSGSAGTVTSDPSKSAAANFAYKPSAYAGFTFATTPGTGDWFMIDGETRPFGAWEYSTAIANGHQLQLMAMDLGADYTLVRDIDLAPALAAVGGKYPGMWSERGFKPVGNNLTRSDVGRFTGTFDGRGHVISGLTITRPNEDGVGLFGTVNGAEIRNLGLQRVSVTGGDYVGGLVGSQGVGMISSVYVTGMVSGAYEVGGVLGRLAGDRAGDPLGYRYTYSTLERSYADVEVSGGARAGGLVGYQVVGKINQAYATGAVSGTEAVGGLVGWLNSGDITDAYATGAVYGSSAQEFTDMVGGLVGYQAGLGTISRSYATGSVDTASYSPLVGGLLGAPYGGAAVEDSYWNSTVNSVGVGAHEVVTPGIFNATGLATTEFQDTAGFMTRAGAAGWDFEQVWAPPSDGFYPQLYGLSPVQRVDIDDVIATYGDTVILTAQTYGGPGRYVFGPANDALSTPALQMASANAGTTLITGASTTTSAMGTVYRNVYVGEAWATIGQRVLTVTANAADKGYDGTAWSGGNGVAYVGFANGDTEAVLGGALVWGGDSQGAKAAGTYKIALTGLGNGNYRYDYIEGALTITPRPVSVTAGGGISIYGDTPINPGLEAVGLADGEDITVLTGLGNSFGITGATDAGTYQMLVGGALTNANYQVTALGAGTWDVTPRPITLTADQGQSRLYGDIDPRFTYAVTAGSLVFGQGWSGSLGRANGENAGSYGLTSGDLAVDDGNGGRNYSMSFIGANFVIARAPLIIAAISGSKVYGMPDPTLGFIASGLKLDDDGAVITGAPLRDAGELVAAGPYTIRRGNLAAGDNYSISFVDADFAIAPRAIILTANDLHKLLGATDPALSWSLTGGSFADVDTAAAVLRGGMLRDPGELPGRYGIGQGGLLANANYVLTVLPGSFTIDPVAITTPTTGEQALPDEPQQSAAAEAASDTLALCQTGVLLASACQAYVHPANRVLDFVSFSQ